MRNAWTSGVDTISNLPCNVLDAVLGCLRWKDAVKTSILSKDWRYKWVTRQELDFNDEFFKSFKQDEEAKRIIYQVLLVHKGPILKFRFCRITSYPDIDHWMHFLLKKNVQEFTLHVSLGNEYHSPHHLFTFQQLRFLELQDCLFHPPLSFKEFEKLINLDLVRVTFDPSIFTYLIFKCPLLEQLRLRCCTNFDILEIDAANLKFYEFIGTSRLLYQVWVGDIYEPVVQLLRAQPSSSGVVKLQRVQVNMFTGLEMEMEFILASAPVLEEIFIWNCTRFLFRSCKQMIDEMKEFRSASTNVEFTFEEIDMEGGYEHEEVMEVP
ncbi:hypothetical protein MTR67_004695 [Solanum verrucosum]|uniref:At1g61320/AtMIF1 LRR domain-containing protein n=1 Tax=Solanum verrucosum TaxID=315347 RepID=A0AAF0PY29_SOLVR|nr:hypothetical protein MTR67_004695 [Solanum verrucosum]